MTSKELVLLIVVCVLFGVIFLAVVISDIVNTTWRHELIKRGHAEYSQTTGKWQWKESGLNE